MTVTQLFAVALNLARSQYSELVKTWITISHRIGGRLPRSLLMVRVQRIGDLDVLLRCMEDEIIRPPAEARGELTYLALLSEIWVSAAYEVFRLLKHRNLAPDNDAFRTLAHDLRMLRVPLEKHEIAADGKLPEPALMQTYRPGDDNPRIYEYFRSDPKKAHIMPSGLSSRGSVTWGVSDPVLHRFYFLERRDLSDRIIAFGESLKQTDATNEAGE